MKAVAPAAVQALEESVGSSCSDCTDCLHCTDPALKARLGVRVSVNLRQFFSDQRARAFMWAPYGRCVKWLSRRVARVFGLSDNIALMSRGHMLPIIEPLLMLDCDDPIEVVKMSYVYTPQDDPKATRLRTTNETSSSNAGTNERLALSNDAVTQDTISQLLSISQGDKVPEHQETLTISRTNLTEDMLSTIESQERQRIDEGEDLQRLKRHALRLLDTHCHILQEASAPKRLRRRRHRRRTQAATNISLPDRMLLQSNVSATELDSSTCVLRNGIGSRTPRLVRALSPLLGLDDNISS